MALGHTGVVRALLLDVQGETEVNFPLLRRGAVQGGLLVLYIVSSLSAMERVVEQSEAEPGDVL